MLKIRDSEIYLNRSPTELKNDWHEGQELLLWSPWEA